MFSLFLFSWSQLEKQLFWWVCLCMWLGFSLLQLFNILSFFYIFTVLTIIWCGEFLFLSWLFGVLASWTLIGISLALTLGGVQASMLRQSAASCACCRWIFSRILSTQSPRQWALSPLQGCPPPLPFQSGQDALAKHLLLCLMICKTNSYRHCSLAGPWGCDSPLPCPVIGLVIFPGPCYSSQLCCSLNGIENLQESTVQHSWDFLVFACWGTHGQTRARAHCLPFIEKTKAWKSLMACCTVADPGLKSQLKRQHSWGRMDWMKKVWAQLSVGFRCILHNLDSRPYPVIYIKIVWEILLTPVRFCVSIWISPDNTTHNVLRVHRVSIMAEHGRVTVWQMLPLFFKSLILTCQVSKSWANISHFML